MVVLYLAGLAIYNISSAASLVTNPIPVTIVTLTMVILADGGKAAYLPRIRRALAQVFILFSVLSLFLNIEHVATEGFAARTKGFGSGTLYATLSVIAIVFYTSRLKRSEINVASYLLLCATPAWSLLMTQSRGAALTLAITLMIMSAGNVRALGKLAFLLIAGLAAFFLFEPNLADVGLIRRITPDNFQDLEQFSSGRIVTHLAIIRWFETESSALALAWGKGLNELKAIVAQFDLEFPHFDLLYVLYDGGVVSAAMFVLLLGLMIAKGRVRQYTVIFALSGLHTNMIASPALIVFLYLLTVCEGAGRAATPPPPAAGRPAFSV